MDVECCIICNKSRKLKSVNSQLKKCKIIDLIYKCFYIQFLDKHYGKMNKICKKCIRDLNFCFDFKRRIEIGHQKLYKIYSIQQSYVKHKSNSETENINLTNLETFNSQQFNEESQDNLLEAIKNEVIDDSNDKNEFTAIEFTNLQPIDVHNYDLNKSDSEWSTNTDDVLVSTGYWQEVERLESRKPYVLPKLNNDSIQCPLCEECIDDKTKLQSHYNRHNLSIFLCHICGQLYTQKFSFQGHMSKHNNETFPCPDCDKIYISKSGLLFHIKHVHLKMNLYTCRKCQMTFSEWSQRLNHMEEVHGYVQEYSCDQCGKTFKRRNKLNDHIRRFHLRERNRVCHFCSARFFSKMELQKHILKHTGEKEQHCQFCGKAFGHRQYLTEHLKIHLNIKKFKCDICGKAFVQKCSLLGHIKTNHKSHNIDS